MEPGDWTGDHHSERPPQQCGLSEVLQQCLPGLHRLHLVHQSVGHPGRRQVCAHTHVSVPA